MFPPSGMLAATAAVSNTDAHVSVFSLLARLLISLFIVLMVLWVLAQIVRRKGLPGSRGGGGRAARRQVDVLNRQVHRQGPDPGHGPPGRPGRPARRDGAHHHDAQRTRPGPLRDRPGSERRPRARGGRHRRAADGSDGSDTVWTLDPTTLDLDAGSTPTVDQVRRLPSTSTSSTSASSTAASMTSTMFSWNQRLDRLRDRTVRR